MESDVSKSFPLISRDIAESLKALARTKTGEGKSKLSLPEINAVAELVAQIAPAGNVPSVILNGLLRLGRRAPADAAQKDVNQLFQGMDKMKDSAVYGAFFATPAAVIWAYQNLLKLAGKDPAEFFPDGLWQFYVEYALREDTARHANETRGFDVTLRRLGLHLSAADRAAAWVMAAAQVLHHYPALLENEWRERVHTMLLYEQHRDTPVALQYAKLYRQWEVQRPYSHAEPTLAGVSAYPQFRREQFDRFLNGAMNQLPLVNRRAWAKLAEAAEADDLPAYQRQMTLLAYLQPSAYNEERTPLPLAQAQVGVILHGYYFLIPACAPGGEQLVNGNQVRAQLATLFSQPVAVRPTELKPLAEVKRAMWPDLRQKLSPGLLTDLDTLRSAPILINCDQRSRDLSLADLRRSERGVGDHGLTIFDTGESFVFDQSHIFFDGAWGAALAEIMTHYALAWARHFQLQPALAPVRTRTRSLAFRLAPADVRVIQAAPRCAVEAVAENEDVNVQAILAQRQLFQRVNDRVRLTVNDILILYRAIHAASYQPEAGLTMALNRLAHDPALRAAAQAALEAINPAKQLNPAMLIPVDASPRSPRDRLQPMNFEVPLADLNLLKLHRDVMLALRAYQDATANRATHYAHFDELQREYLATLAGFGEVMAKAREVTLSGENATMGTLKLLAHMPAPLQRLLHQIPGRFDVLNDLIQGREVFSNVGQVAPTSSLTRFLTAKDDNDKKTLAWGVLTNVDGGMHMTLRDFRPHVGLLAAVGQSALANRLTQDYLDAYARGLNAYIRDLRHIVITSQDARFPATRLSDAR